MNMKKISIIVLLSFVFISSCTFPFMTRRSFKLLYDGENTGLERFIQMDGVYYSSVVWSYNQMIDSTQLINSGRGLLFYRDGIFIRERTDNAENYFKKKSRIRYCIL